jgi:heme A synthase
MTTVHGGLVLALHQGFARVVILYTGLMALWGLFLFLRGSNPSGGYLGALVLDEAVIIVQGLLGAVLLAQGHRPQQGLHLLYGVASVVALPTAYLAWCQSGTERRDSLILGLAALFLVGLAIRGIMTG